MDYGRIQIPIPQKIMNDLEAIKDLVDREEITESEAANKRRKTQRKALLFIAQTNAANRPKHRSHLDKKNFRALRKDVEESRIQEIIEKILKEDESPPNTTTPENSDEAGI